MSRGNVYVSGPYEGLYYIDNDDYYVYRQSEDLGDWPETRLLRDLDCDELTDEKWLYDDEGTSNELEDIEECFIEDFTKMFPSFVRCLPNAIWCHNATNTRCSEAILENGLFYIAIEDNEWSMAVELVQKDDSCGNLAGLQKQHWQRYLEGIKRSLLNRLPKIHYRTGAWTSGEIKRERKSA